MKETAKREGIVQAKIEYYKDFFEIFNKSNMSDLYIAKVNIKELKDLFNKLVEETKNKETKNEVQEKEKQDKLTK